MRKVVGLLLAAVVGSFWVGEVPATAQKRIVIVGSGSNVPLRLYQAWATEFNKKHLTTQVQYLALGTSESVKQISEGSEISAAEKCC